MSRDYKTTNQKSGRGGGSLLMGILIGLVLGLGIALAVAWYINNMPGPFLNRAGPPVKDEPKRGVGSDLAKGADKSGQAQNGKPRFDFYKILPGTEEPVTEQQFKEAQQKPSTVQPQEAFFLQAGAFQSASDADNLKAQLALLGMEASIQTSVLPDKGVWHRVRVGPYTAIDDLNRARNTLKQNGVETTLLKVRETPVQPGK